MQGALRMPRTALRFGATPTNPRRPAHPRPVVIRGVAPRRACAALVAPSRSAVDVQGCTWVPRDWTDVGCLEEERAQDGAPDAMTSEVSSAR